MKTILLLILMSGLSFLNAAAEPPRDRPREKPASPVQRHMQELRDQDPDEFSRLQKLRSEDPEAFRAEMRSIIEDRFMKMLQRERPDIFEALSGLPAEDRAWLIKRLEARPAGPGPDQNSGHQERKGGKNGQFAIKKWVEQYHAETESSKREELEAQIRAAVAQEYDARIRMRAAQVQEMEIRIDELKKMLARGEEEKQRFIDRKMALWLGREAPQD